jgi:delta24-sterol reductase
MEHTELVKAISAQVKAFAAVGKPWRIYHGSTNSTRTLSFDREAMIDTSSLNRVLQVDVDRRVALVEPGVAMDELVDATLPHRLVPPVVPEFPGITVGGGAQGGAGESSSFKFGGLSNTINWYEMILPNGDVVRASANEHADLYWGMAGSYGTLGVITAMEIRLIPAKRYVDVDYLSVTSFEEATAATIKATNADYDFVDGIMLSRDRGYIIVGRMTDVPSHPIKRFDRAFDEWFYLTVAAKKTPPASDSIPLKAYLFRYDRGAFWMGTYAFRRFKVPFNLLTRWLLNPLMKTRVMYRALQGAAAGQEYVVQDLAMPTETVAGFMSWVDERFACYPLWLCPLPVDTQSPMYANYLKTKSVLNVGVWTLYRRDYDQWLAANRELEAAVAKFGGRKWLYAPAFYSEKEFWNIYDQKWYESLRAKYHATKLPSVFDKVTHQRRYRVSNKAGLIKAVLGHNGIRYEDKNR